MYHFTVENTRFTTPLMCRGKTKFATIKWYNLCLQIIQSQMCYPLIITFLISGSWKQEVFVKTLIPKVATNSKMTIFRI